MKAGAPIREHRPSNLLSREENESIFSFFGPRCESLATTVVQVFVTSPPDHCDWTKLDAGVLCLIKDHLKRSYYFRLYCPERRTCVWEHEVYNNMVYNAPRPFLHTFEAQDCIVAFNFATEEEAAWLRSILLDKLESKKQRRERRMRNSFHPRETPATKPHHMSNGSISTGNKYPTSNPSSGPTTGGVFNNSRDGQKKNKKKNAKKLNKADIGIPLDFRHVSHVGWDANKGFDLAINNEESPELKTFFQKAGVSDSQLQDRETRDFIYEFIQHNGGIDRAVNEVLQVDDVNTDTHHPSGPPPLPVRNTPLANRAAPPPPPLRTVPAPPPPTQTPPPPPPSRLLSHHPTSIAGGAPPPPPPPPPLSSAAPASPPPPLPSTPAPDLAPDSHSALMESIRSGTTLKKVELDSESRTSNSDSRNDLLNEIRQGKTLRPVQPVAKSSPSGPPEHSLAKALADALAKRSHAIHSDSSDSSDEDEDDDEEWED